MKNKLYFIYMRSYELSQGWMVRLCGTRLVLTPWHVGSTIPRCGSSTWCPPLKTDGLTHTQTTASLVPWHGHFDILMAETLEGCPRSECQAMPFTGGAGGCGSAEVPGWNRGLSLPAPGPEWTRSASGRWAQGAEPLARSGLRGLGQDRLGRSGSSQAWTPALAIFLLSEISWCAILVNTTVLTGEIRLLALLRSLGKWKRKKHKNS